MAAVSPGGRPWGPRGLARRVLLSGGPVAATHGALILSVEDAPARLGALLLFAILPCVLSSRRGFSDPLTGPCPQSSVALVAGVRRFSVRSGLRCGLPCGAGSARLCPELASRARGCGGSGGPSQAPRACLGTRWWPGCLWYFPVGPGQPRDWRAGAARRD